MFSKINISKIVVDHIRTFQNVRTGRYSFSDFFLFFGFPIAAGIYFGVFERLCVGESYINFLIASISIIAGFLFNLLAIIFGIMDKVRTNVENDPVKQKLAAEIHSNIAFNILLAIFSVVSLLFANSENFYVALVANTVSISLCILFFLTILMVLKRIYIIMSKEGIA
ncbi:hypothetical protein GCM10007415_25340 [Parapedobacter pyrenivorans]|uniref:Uncharacterized protein n=1 Tax=Parapedobacter pyrenivorans TaxID=1305674 RepID=A0A917HUZ0_9SPHI|nr:hypothetical protein [Parapedobacter pyrenivorans]GGG89952.1 hypothetical protein GCM10007415_25340 [Parapedobacter pyrenivorans]